MSDRSGLFAGNDPFAIARAWLAEAEQTEPNDANAIALSTVDADGLPNTRMVLLKDIEAGSFVFYTNYESKKAAEIDEGGRAAFVLHWKSLRRQIRVRGDVTREDGPQADAYYNSRSLKSRLGAWASDQSRPLDGRQTLIDRVEEYREKYGEENIPRPPHWSGFRIKPDTIEFWQDGEFRPHDRIVLSPSGDGWDKVRLYP